MLNNVLFLLTNITEENANIGSAILMELFVTIHMSVFVLFPLANIINVRKPTETFAKLFILRVIILTICNCIFGFMTAIIDFIAVFIGAFIVVPFLGACTLASRNKPSYRDYEEVKETDLLNIGIKDSHIIKNKLLKIFEETELALTNNNELKIKELCNEEMSQKILSIIDFNKEHNLKNVIENFIITESKIIGARQNYVEQKITIVAKVSKKDYIKDALGNVTNSSSKKTKHLLYELEFIKELIKENINIKEKNKCENCGAPTNSKEEKCSYCGTTNQKNIKNKNWVLSDKKIITTK